MFIILSGKCCYEIYQWCNGIIINLWSGDMVKYSNGDMVNGWCDYVVKCCRKYLKLSGDMFQ